MSVVIYVRDGRPFGIDLVGPIDVRDATAAQSIADELFEEEFAASEDGFVDRHRVSEMTVPDGIKFQFPAGTMNARYGLPVEGSAVPYRLVGR